MATPSSILVWKIPWTEEPGRLQSMRLPRVGCDWTCMQHTYAYVFMYSLTFIVSFLLPNSGYVHSFSNSFWKLVSLFTLGYFFMKNSCIAINFPFRNVFVTPCRFCMAVFSLLPVLRFFFFFNFHFNFTIESYVYIH